jgi:hypothetical protein
MENKANEGSAQSGEGQNQNTGTKSVEELQKEIEALAASNKRLLDESKGFKEKYKMSEAEKAKHEEKIALEKGDLQKLLELSRADTAKFKSENETLREKALNQEIVRTVSQYATDALNIEDVMNQPAYLAILKEAADRDNLTVNPEKAKTFVEEVRKAKPYLFKSSSQPVVVTKKPGSPGVMTPKSLNELESKDIEAMLRSGQFRN